MRNSEVYYMTNKNPKITIRIKSMYKYGLDRQIRGYHFRRLTKIKVN